MLANELGRRPVQSSSYTCEMVDFRQWYIYIYTFRDLHGIVRWTWGSGTIYIDLKISNDIAALHMKLHSNA
jgi:hypothetical protein